MSKKHKNKSIWDITPEEQMKSADDFYKFEKGENTDVFSITKGKMKQAPVGGNGLTSELEHIIANRILGNKPEETDKVAVAETTPTVQNTKESTDTSAVITTTSDKSDTSLRPIKFIINKLLNRLVIDDGIAPTSFSYESAKLQEIINGTYDDDDDEILDLCDMFKMYIISLKHPTAILTAADYVDVMADVKGYDHNKFAFMSAYGYVMCYLIDEDSYDEFMDYPDELNLKPEDLLQVYVSMAYTVGTIQNAFFVEDLAYILKLYDSNELNSKDEFILALRNDAATTLLDEVPLPSDESHNEVIDLEDFHTIVRTTLSHISGDDVDEDDDYVEELEAQMDEEDDDEDDVDPNTDPEFTAFEAKVSEEVVKVSSTDSMDTSDDKSVDSLLPEGADIIDTPEETQGNKIDVVEHNNSDDMVIPVKHKN